MKKTDYFLSKYWAIACIIFFSQTAMPRLLDVAYATGCLYLSAYNPLYLNRQSRSIVRRAVTINPAARTIASSKLYNYLPYLIPIAGKHLRCTNTNCSGICNDCKLKCLFKEAPIKLLLLQYYYPIGDYFIVPLWGLRSLSQALFGSD